jgi:hypothetical protein
MHTLSVKVSICGGTFQPIWNYPLLAKTSLDYVMDMETCVTVNNPPSSPCLCARSLATEKLMWCVCHLLVPGVQVCEPL